jgi:hypothetical protein
MLAASPAANARPSQGGARAGREDRSVQAEVRNLRRADTPNEFRVTAAGTGRLS